MSINCKQFLTFFLLNTDFEEVLKINLMRDLKPLPSLSNDELWCSLVISLLTKGRDEDLMRQVSCCSGSSIVDAQAIFVLIKIMHIPVMLGFTVTKKCLEHLYPIHAWTVHQCGPQFHTWFDSGPIHRPQEWEGFCWGPWSWIIGDTIPRNVGISEMIVIYLSSQK